MVMPRTVAAETLDHLAPDDPNAIGSRRDLKRIHKFMGTQNIVLQALAEPMLLGDGLDSTGRSSDMPVRILELGAGDGSLLAGVAAALANRSMRTASTCYDGAPPIVEISLLDRQGLITQATIDQFAAVGWTATPIVMDVLEWARKLRDAGGANTSPSPPASSATQRWDFIVASLFLHHFEHSELRLLLAAIEARTDRFFACEPRRAWLALAGSHMIGAIGANAVTREDAVLSVRAGFRDAELTAMWPDDRTDWSLSEYPAGLFSHCFMGARTGALRKRGEQTGARPVQVT